jgi:hypothetical protein
VAGRGAFGAETAVRNDTGVFEGGEISMFYDPMIAKLCTWGADRPRRIEAMRVALDSFEVEGIGHNLPFLSAVMDHPRFVSGEITTAFIAEEYPEGFRRRDAVAEDDAEARRGGGGGDAPGGRDPAHAGVGPDGQPRAPRGQRLGREPAGQSTRCISTPITRARP